MRTLVVGAAIVDLMMKDRPASEERGRYSVQRDEDGSRRLCL